mmetsp:Transcript_42983/g.98027  ORF Transcript_42983/g.98027 Transcript_42983/m.98027 type:complete len:117 (+) Transcript_42983:58-408(+)
MAQSQQFIKQLQAAEDQAEKIIATANANRVKKLQQAKQAAEKEYNEYKEKLNEKFQGEFGTEVADPTNSAAYRQTQMADVQADYDKNKKQVTDYVFNKVVGVNMDLSAIQISTLSK